MLTDDDVRLISLKEVLKLLGGISRRTFYTKYRYDVTFPKPEEAFSSKQYCFYDKEKIKSWINQRL